MASGMVEWMANKLSDQIKGLDARRKFFNDLKHNRDYVVDIFSNDIDQLLMEYTFKKGKVTVLHAKSGDANVFVTCAKEIAAYMHDELFKDEIASIK